MWLAPNVITMTGFSFLISSAVLNLVMNPQLNEAMPSWVYYYSAFCLFLYQTLDNCDGKQSRRTKSASALGMLLDHGADCVA
jgi:phosphatidylglycerophosphate synthase